MDNINKATKRTLKGKGLIWEWQLLFERVQTRVEHRRKQTVNTKMRRVSTNHIDRKSKTPLYGSLDTKNKASLHVSISVVLPSKSIC